MKNLSKIIFAFVIVILSGCNDFLDTPQQKTYTNASFYKTDVQALSALTATYAVTAFVNTDNNLWVFGDVASDDAIKGGLAGDLSDVQFIDEFSYARNNTAIEKIWKRYYEGITRANYLLYYSPNLEMDAALKNRVLAEAKFLRAYFYFNLVNIFGQIPLKVNPPINQEEINKPVSDVGLVYTQIVNDLKDAARSLPRVSTGPDLGRATKGAAYGLLAKAYLYQGQWQNALTAIDSVDKQGLYSLVKVYKNNFIDSTQNNTESLFEIQHLSTQTPKLGSYLNQYFSPGDYGGYYFDAPVQNFIDEFEKTIANVYDPRLDYTVGRTGNKWVNGEAFNPGWSPTGYLNRKHSQPKNEEPVVGDASLNYVYLRYADILLMKAEALNEMGQSSLALVPLNAVRKRARESYMYDVALPGYPVVPAALLPDVATTNQTTLRSAIRHERRVELGFEFHRYFDLMRYGKSPAETALGPSFNYDTKRYFSIPQSEADTNPQIK